MRCYLRLVLSSLCFLTAAVQCFAVPTLDVSHDTGAGSVARFVRSNNFWAQSFTTTSHGMLSQIDVQVSQDMGTERGISFELWPVDENGLPATGAENRLAEVTIPIESIPVLGSLGDPPPFVSVDISDAGIRAFPGDEFAFTLLRGGRSPDPTTYWRSAPDSYADGRAFFRTYLDDPWSQTLNDMGFQAWVDPTPTKPYQMRISPTFDIEYRPGDNPTLIEGGRDFTIGGDITSETFPEQRPILEFPIGDIPDNVQIESTHLELDWGGSSGSPKIEVMGYEGDGLASFSDIDAPGTLVAFTEPTNASSSEIVPISKSYVESLHGQASHLGLRMRSADAPLYVTFYASEIAATSFGTINPPKLVVAYSLLADSLACDADGDGDCEVDDIDAMYAQFGNSGPLDFDGNGMIGPEDIPGWLAAAGSASSTYVPGDLNLNGAVDSDDLGLLLNKFGTPAGAVWSEGDIDGDGIVDSPDLGLLLNKFGYQSAASTVPEPDSICILWLLMISACVVRRRKSD